MLRHLVVIGANPPGLSLAYEAQRAGVEDVVVLEPGEHAVPADAPGRHRLEVRYQAAPVRVEPRPDGEVIVETGTETFLARICVDATTIDVPSSPPSLTVPDGLKGRVHDRLGGFEARDADVLVVGDGERAVRDLLLLQEAGARVVMCFTGDPGQLSVLSASALADLERQRLATILWRSMPQEIADIGGYPMVFFADRHTPDLQFDHVLFAATAEAADAPTGERVHRLGPGGIHPGRAWEEIARRHGDLLPHLRPTARPHHMAGLREIESLRERYYNATITYFDHSHDELWVLRVRPDDHDVSHRPGQYATLGLGYWEPRVDDADEQLTDEARRKLIRRSYSISSRVFDERGYLVDPAQEDEIELYIVHVQPSQGKVPALTPRLADKRAGDRIYLGPKIAGRYTLDPVADPESTVVFLATGTGEAPHNAMIAELFRKGHSGPILSAVTVRKLRDLGYEAVHRRLEERYGNYRYVTLPTREPGVDKRYIQDLIRSGELDELLTGGLDPARAHVFLCGNPAMIGLPEWTEEGPRFPQPEGVCELLHGRGFRIDRRGDIGNVHYEEYW